jgi:hypothetical protein
MKTDKLADALKADLLRRTPKKSTSIEQCFSCGRSFTYRGPVGDNSGRFCSDRCREWYDAGNPAYDSDYLSKTKYSLPIGPKGFYVNCLGCGNRFDSIGLRCCSSNCERTYRDRQENTALMAEVGMLVEAKRKCARPGCSNPVPKWRNGRRVSKRARFCDRHSPHSRKNGRRKRELDPKGQVQAAE